MYGHCNMDGGGRYIFTLTYFSSLALNNQRATNLLTDQSCASTERALTLLTNQRAGYVGGSQWRREDQERIQCARGSRRHRLVA